MANPGVADSLLEDDAARLDPSERCGTCKRPFGPAEAVHPDRNRLGVVLCRRCWTKSAFKAKDPQLQLW